MPDWQDRLRGIWERIRAGRSGSTDTYLGLRSMALGVDPSSMEMSPDEPWSGAAVAAMEIATSQYIASIVVFGDGAVGLYLSNGGAVLGSGEHAAARAEGQRFRTVVADSRGLLVRTSEFPLPGAGEVRFHARIGEDRLTAVASETALRSNRHVLAPLYAAGQDLLTEIRLASEPGER